MGRSSEGGHRRREHWAEILEIASRVKCRSYSGVHRARLKICLHICYCELKFEHSIALTSRICVIGSPQTRKGGMRHGLDPAAVQWTAEVPAEQGLTALSARA